MTRKFPTIMFGVAAMATVPVMAGDVNGDEFFFTVARPPGFVGPQPAIFGDGETWHVILDVTQLANRGTREGFGGVTSKPGYAKSPVRRGF